MAVIEQATGIDVAVLDAGPDEHGLTMGDRVRGTVFIGVARTRNPMRQAGRSLTSSLTCCSGTGETLIRAAGVTVTPAEVRADAFARHLWVRRWPERLHRSTVPIPLSTLQG